MMKIENLTNHVFHNVVKNRTLIILADDGELVDIFSHTADVYPKQDVGRGKFSKKQLLEKVKSEEIRFEKIGKYVI